MQVAKKFNVPFEEICGGDGLCGTCHIKINKEIMMEDDYIEPDCVEIETLDSLEGAENNSRLAC